MYWMSVALTSSSMAPGANASRPEKMSSWSVRHSLHASYAWPYFLYSGHPTIAYSASSTIVCFSATWRITRCTALALLYRSSHLATCRDAKPRARHAKRARV